MIKDNAEIRKVRKSGNSYIVTLPPSILKELGLTVGDEIEFTQENDTININKKEKSSMDDEFLQLVDDIYEEHSETFKLLADK